MSGGYDGGLGAKVESVVMDDTDDGGYARALDHDLAGNGDHEAAIFAWGYVFGVAYGIARGEDPYESNRAAAKRAYAVAEQIHRLFTGRPTTVTT